MFGYQEKEKKSAFFRVSSPKPFGRNGHFGPYFPFLSPSILKKYLTDVFETYRYHDMVIDLCKFKISDLYLFFHGPGGVGNDCAKH